MTIEPDDLIWHIREAHAQYDRIMPVWHAENWWHNNRLIWQQHYLHVSAKDKTLLAYIVNADKGRRDIQTPIKPGRYLTRYFANVLTPKQIAFNAAWQATGQRDTDYAKDDKYTLAFARTPDDIACIYVKGPHSCMDGDNFPSISHQPSRVYGAGDLAIAYLTDNETGRIRARALVWPDKHVAGRIYPTEYCWSSDEFDSAQDSRDCAMAMLIRLQDNGYHADVDNNHFNGARLLKIDRDSYGYVMPYLDNAYGVDDAGEYWRMNDSPDHACQETSGRILADSEDDEDCEPQYDWHCEECGDGQGEDNGSNSVYAEWSPRRGAHSEQAWCDHCVDRNAFHCEATEEWYDRNTVTYVEVDGIGRVVEAWAEANCCLSDRNEDWFDPNTDPIVHMADGATWATSELADHGFRCAITGDCYPNSERHTNYPDVWRGIAETDPDALELYAATVDARQLALTTV